MRWVVPRAWPLVLALLILGPALGPGFVLSYDMVWVPDLALRADFLGFGSGLPRAVPSDAVVAVVDEVVPGMVLQKVVLLAALVLAGEGARRLAPDDDPAAQLAATAFYLWSPLVAERLVIGHWPLLLTYASLPWIFLWARRLRAGTAGYAPIVLWLALAGLSAAGGVLASVFAILCVLGRDRGAIRRVAAVGSAALLVNAPWLVAGALHGDAAVSDPTAVGLFAASGEGGMPAWLTVLGLGGIWNAEVVPASRTSWPAVVALVVTLALATAGARRLHRHRSVPRRGCPALVTAAALGLVVALAGWLAPAAMEWVVGHVPGAGILRDGTRALVLLAPLLVVLVAHGVRAVIERLPAAGVRTAAATALVLAPVALLPDLAAGAGGRLDPVDFPDEYAEARTALDDRVQSRSGTPDLLVLPFSTYRLPEWNDGRPTLDPLGRFMTPDYLASDVLVVSGTTVAGEDRRAARVQRLLEAAQGPDGTSEAELVRGLRGEGVGWVLLDRSAQAQLAGRVPSAVLEEQPVVHRGDALVVWELTGAVAEPASRGAVARGVLWLAWFVYLAVLTIAALGAPLTRFARPRRGSRPSGC